MNIGALLATKFYRQHKPRIADRMLNREPSCLHWFKRGDRPVQPRPMWEGTGRARRIDDAS